MRRLRAIDLPRTPSSSPPHRVRRASAIRKTPDSDRSQNERRVRPDRRCMIGVIVASPTSSAPPASARAHPPAEVRLLEIPAAVDSRKHPNSLPPRQPRARRRWSRLPATGSRMPKRSRSPDALCAPASQHQNWAGLSTLSIVAVDGWMKPKACRRAAAGAGGWACRWRDPPSGTGGWANRRLAAGRSRAPPPPCARPERAESRARRDDIIFDRQLPTEPGNPLKPTPIKPAVASAFRRDYD